MTLLLSEVAAAALSAACPGLRIWSLIYPSQAQQHSSQSPALNAALLLSCQCDQDTMLQSSCSAHLGSPPTTIFTAFHQIYPPPTFRALPCLITALASDSLRGSTSAPSLMTRKFCRHALDGMLTPGNSFPAGIDRQLVDIITVHVIILFQFCPRGRSWKAVHILARWLRLSHSTC